MSGTIESDALLIGSRDVPYRIVRKIRKRVAIEVHPDLTVIVRAPQDADTDAIKRLVSRKSRWIRRQFQFFESFLPRTPKRRLLSGETHRYLGRQYQLRVRRSTEERVKLEGGYLWILTNDPKSFESKEQLLRTWYRIHAERLFTERLVACAAHSELRHAKPTRVVIRSMKKRWGSCSPRGVLTLNIELVKARRVCIDYVITHELCHLLFRNHSPGFVRLLDRIMPDSLKRKEILERSLV